MTRREIIAVALWAVAFLLIFGTVGSWDFGYDITALDIVKIIIGMVLLIIAIPVSGELDVDEDEDIGREEKPPLNSNSASGKRNLTQWYYTTHERKSQDGNDRQ